MRHRIFLDELLEIEQSGILESENLKQIRETYFRINLNYIRYCENNAEVHYFPSSRCDALFERHHKTGNRKRAAKIISRRLGEIRRAIIVGEQ